MNARLHAVLPDIADIAPPIQPNEKRSRVGNGAYKSAVDGHPWDGSSAAGGVDYVQSLDEISELVIIGECILQKRTFGCMQIL